jgi:hypothetical protein
MSRRQFWRWLLLGDEDWPWVSRLTLWQYLLVDWAIAVLAGLVAFAIAAAILRHFPPLGWLIAWIGTVSLVRPALARRRWRRIQAQVPPARTSTQN